MAGQTPAERRLRKELMALLRDPNPAIFIDKEKIESNISQWNVQLMGPENTLYAGEKFQLLFQFTNSYPFEAPRVIFVGPNIPIHPHVYSNGHICLSIFTEDWSPTLSIHSVCVSIMSMLSTCKNKVLPKDNDVYVKTCKSNPNETSWCFHDDQV